MLPPLASIESRRAVLALAAGFLLLGGVFGALLLLNRVGDDHAHARLRAAQIESRLAEMQTVPWHADLKSPAVPKRVVRADLAVTAAGIRAELRKLQQVASGPRIERIIELQEKNTRILQRQLRTVAANEQSQAKAARDAAERGYIQLREELTAIGKEFDRSAERAHIYAKLGTALLLLGLYLAFATSVLLLARAQSRSAARDARIRQTQKLEAVGQLASGIAHDFNNLLLGIRGFAELARSSLDPTTGAHKDIGEAIAASDRAAALTRQLLAFSRDQALVPAVIDPNAAVRDVVSFLEQVLSKEIRLDVELAQDLPGVEIDPGQFDQVILNLALNARDAMPDSGRLLISTARTDEGVLISVSDTGTGIEQQVLDRVFEPFFSTKEVGAGSGLGLATVWAIVSRSGGRVEVETELGHGTCFHVHLPAAAKRVTTTSTRAQNPEPHTRTGAVLVVDDDEVVRGFVVRALEHAGYQVLQTSGGKEALALMSTTPVNVDLLITDMTMPGLSGQDLAERLEPLPVVFISGHPTEILLEGRDTAFIQKPFAAGDLVSAVDRLLNQTRGADIHALADASAIGSGD